MAPGRPSRAGAKAFVSGEDTEIEAELFDGGTSVPVTLSLPGVTRGERDMLLAGCLMNAYRAEKNN
ncbi:MAG: hypothetical protein SOY64_01915 [Pyramidobacter sp.]|uniref:hypothetical protein n=1 Tax=Pyramidobacter sp. TaxID=1943581 RepID=UPI002A7F6F28|nr:hypothetical protein [Pyramidobacter sp.]MDY4031810.1 hypothetical protein [Pyramidobacter sp.]